MTNLSLLRFSIAGFFAFGGFIHWLAIFGYYIEYAPQPILWYFHSLAVINFIACVGIVRDARWGYIVAFLIAVTQIPSHAYMLYLDQYFAYGSGVHAFERVIDIAFAVFIIIYVWLRERAGYVR